MLKYIFLIGLLMFSTPALALEEQAVYSTETYTIEDITSQIKNYTKTPDGGVAWEVFSETKESPYKITRDGEEWEGVKPEFTDTIKQFNGETVKMSGYMFPLDQTDEQSQFLFGPFPLSCPYHYHAPNSLTIEVHTDKPIKFTYDPITITGTLELVPEDYDYNTFYRLNDASIVK